MKKWLFIGVVVVGGLVWWRVDRERVERTGQLVLQTGRFRVTPETPGYENYQKLSQGCPVRDCIPALTAPKLETAEAASRWLRDDEIVFGLDYKGEQRAYPQKILNWHEIVNDNMGGDPIGISFCPLCGSALGFDRRVEGKTLTFGVSGKLHNSDLVMYDKETESLWQQITLEAIVGELLGSKLTPMVVDTMRWKQWRETFPQTKVLSRETGYQRDYESYPYGDYESSREVYFPVERGVDEEIHPKTVVYGIVVGGEAKAYPLEQIETETRDDGVLIDTLGGQRLRLSYSRGEVAVENLKTREQVMPTRLFWFAWKAFYPETQLYEMKGGE